MKCLFSALSIILLIHTASGQNGYNKTYTIGDISSSFANITLSDDTVVAYGFYFVDTISYQQGIFFSKIDTNGNIVMYNLFADTLGDDYAYCSNCSVIKTSSSDGYLLVGNLLQRTNGFIIRVDNDGDLLFFKEYNDPQSIVDFYSKAIEVDGGFIIAGMKQKSNYLLDAFVMWIDTAGNKIWEKSFGGEGRHHSINSLILKDNNTIILGIATSSGQSTPLSQVTLQTKIIAIDSNGIQKWNWETPYWLEEGGITGLYQDFNKSWIYTCGKVEIDISQNSFAWQPKIIKRDSSFNIVWTKEIGEATSSLNGFSDLMVGPDENYVAVGQIIQTSNSQVLNGLFFKVSANGDSIWSVLDTAFWDPSYGSENYISGVVILPSGSIIACGYSNTYSPTAKSWSWLIKINKDGCIDTLNCVVSSTITEKNHNDDVSIFPNPTMSEIYLNISENIDLRRINVLDSSGKIVENITYNNMNYFNLSEYTNGMYVFQFICKDRIIIKKIIKV